MAESTRAVVVFRGGNEFEAQLVRDMLASSMIPVLHVPSIYTGVFGVARRVAVAVPVDRASEARDIVRDAGFEPEPDTESDPQGIFPTAPPLSPGEQSGLRRGLFVVAVGMLAILVWLWSRSGN